MLASGWFDEPHALQNQDDCETSDSGQPGPNCERGVGSGARFGATERCARRSRSARFPSQRAATAPSSTRNTANASSGLIADVPGGYVPLGRTQARLDHDSASPVSGDDPPWMILQPPPSPLVRTSISLGAERLSGDRYRRGRLRPRDIPVRSCRPEAPPPDAAMPRATASPRVDRAIRLTDGRLIAYAESGDLTGRPLVFLRGTPLPAVICLDEEATEAAGVRLLTVIGDGADDVGRAARPGSAPRLTDRQGSGRPGAFACRGWQHFGHHSPTFGRSRLRSAVREGRLRAITSGRQRTPGGEPGVGAVDESRGRACWQSAGIIGARQSFAGCRA